MAFNLRQDFMTKNKTIFVCQECGSSQSKWSGQCDKCGTWNSLLEEALPNRGSSDNIHHGKIIELVNLNTDNGKSEKFSTGIDEFNRVCGGGLVAGSSILIAGEPGIGKSTLLLQILCSASSSKLNLRCIYLSGEESVGQIRIRGQRLNLLDSSVQLANSTNINDIRLTLEKLPPPDVVAIDSIQTLQSEKINSAAGSVAQVRGAAQELIQIAKEMGFTLILVGHVTKEGTIAGPKILEHMVDTVLYFDGDQNLQYRILRATKNRFGSVDEIGVFTMTAYGLTEVKNPSSFFISNHNEGISGTSIFVSSESSRPMLLEIQVLIANTEFGTPRRTVVGWDINRLNMLLAVLEARCKVSFSQYDIYLNVVGGLKIKETAADLAVAAALISSHLNKPIVPGTIIFGEIGLSGEIRQVNNNETRLKEAFNLGFSNALIPELQNNNEQSRDFSQIKSKQNIIYIKSVDKLIHLIKTDFKVSK